MIPTLLESGILAFLFLKSELKSFSDRNSQPCISILRNLRERVKKCDMFIKKIQLNIKR